MLEVIDLSKKYKDVYAVNGIRLYLESGETVGLLGPNGAGKSTSISMISSLIKPTKGDIKWRGSSIVTKPHVIRKELGIVPQEIALYDELTALENLQLFGKIYGLKGKALEEEIEKVLHLIGLTEQKKQIVKTFSGGMKRRLNIGVALLHRPQLLIMDEPTVGIDPQSRHHILETVRRLNREEGISVLYTSHYMEEVEALCDRIYIMDRGQIIASGTKDELKAILTSEQTVIIQVQGYAPPFVNEINELPAVTSITEENGKVTIIVPKTVHILDTLFEKAKQTEVSITSVEVKTPTLEDVFLHLTGRTLRD